jgi:hypothetical protein
MMRCDAQHLAPHVGAAPADPKRAKQDIPPALRRQVLRRDGRRCAVPGCRHGSFLDLHHIEARADGGAHELDNLITLCGAHHRARHEGELRVEGRVSSGLRFSHADGTDYGAVMNVNESAVGAQVKAFQALRQLGFAEREAKRALASVADEVGADAGVEAVLRAALRRLSADAFRQAS